MKIFFFFYRLLLSVRYKVTLTGSEELQHDGPILLLPNHIALVDPRILLAFLGKYIAVSPVASEKYYNMPILKQIMGLVGTVPIGEMGAGASAEDVKKVFDAVVKELQGGKNILIYPSGQVFRQGFESIVGKQSVYNIVKLMPENTKIIGIKTRGLWGSMRSMAWNNMETGFFRLFFRSIWLVGANLIFFVPKRNVNISIHDITQHVHVYKNMGLNEFNGYLESFYNSESSELVQQYGNIEEIDGKGIFVENTNFIKHFFYYDDVKNRKLPDVIEGSLEELNQVKNHDLSQVPASVREKIIEKIVGMKEAGREGITDESKLILDLYFDSLDAAELKSFVQAQFQGSSNPPIGDLKTIGDVLIMAVGQSQNVERLKECDWGKAGKEAKSLVKKIS